jgi:fatty-acyl-CoA synthase
MSETRKEDPIHASGSSAKAWLRALELTSPIASNRHRILPTVIEEIAARLGDAPALLSDRESLTYSDLAERANQYARWALGQGLAKGDVVCLLMANRPEYMAVWLGITSVGVVVSLLNTNLVGLSLAQCIRVVSPKHIIAAAECIDALTTALPHLEAAPSIWAHGPKDPALPRIDLDVARYSGESLSKEERRPPTIDDRALYIYTSGTTGLPKAANVSHGRVMQWSHWFAGMMEVLPTDRMYNCLPMYHSVGGVQTPGAVLVAGGTVVIREKFSTSHFWSDILRWGCTLFQYIGELCRYLLHAAPSEQETEHRIRLACGNGLAPEVWDAFKDRFRIPRILEFYAATEGSVSLFNVQGKRGAIGHIPPYLAHRFSPALVLFDVETGEPARNEQGFCIRCAPNQPGEALGKVVDDPSSVASRFEGYTTKADTEKKILRNVFEQGDAWIRTGDLMRKDERGFFYFVDRIGDTFRRKGENVATSEVLAAICAFPGVRHANVYGVAVPGLEGRVGMATLVADDKLDLAGFRKHLASCLPPYARPLFLRIRSEVEVTGTFKYSKTELARQGYDPVASNDALYFDLLESETFVQLDKDLYNRIQSGRIRL